MRFSVYIEAPFPTKPRATEEDGFPLRLASLPGFMRYEWHSTKGGYDALDDFSAGSLDLNFGNALLSD